MAVNEKTRWKRWADELRQEMMTNLQPEVTKSVDAISTETATSKTASTLHSARFWRACQSGTGANDHLASAGFEIEFEPDETRQVQEVTFRLNRTWMSILEQVLDRKRV